MEMKIKTITQIQFLWLTLKKKGDNLRKGEYGLFFGGGKHTRIQKQNDNGV